MPKAPELTSAAQPAAQAAAKPAVPGNTSAALGIVFGMLAVLMWALYMVYAKKGITLGLQGQDFVLARFGTGFLIFLPFVFWKGIGKAVDGVGFAKGLALSAAAGPIFVGLATGGYAYTSLANGAVIQPSTAALSGMVLSAFVLKERIGFEKLFGAALMIVGIALLASTKPGEASSASKWVGDLMFIIAGFCWTAYTVMIKRWNIDGITATKYISLISGSATIVAFFAFDTFDRLQATGLSYIILMAVIYGLMSGILAMIAYSSAVHHLGASRAALFPAMVPGATVIIGIPIAGIWPTAIEWLGAVLATIGLAIAMGVINRLRSKRTVQT